MLSQFSTFFQLGVDHITDINGYDHIVFLIALCAGYALNQWRRVAILITAFTIGHSFTLALAALQIVSPWYAMIEKLIPCTIIFTALYNLREEASDNYETKISSNHSFVLKYFCALVFGLIHGLAFSNYFKVLQGAGQNIVQPLFAFNIGIEVGQLSILFFILTVSYFVLNILKISLKSWRQFISGVAFGIALTLLMR